MKNNNMFNTVKKGIIRSAALLLLAGFCGNVSADYADFEKAIAKGDFTEDKVEDTIKSFCEKIKGGDTKYNAIKPEEIDSKIIENAELSNIFAGVLQKNYEISEILRYLAGKGKDVTLKQRYETALKNFNYNLLDALLKGKMPNGKISNKDEADFIKVAYRSFYNNAGNLLAAYYTKGVIADDMSFLQGELSNATQALKDINNAINNHGVEIDDLDSTNETLANVQVAVNALEAQIGNVETAKADAENNLAALLDWGDKDNAPEIEGFEGSALKALVEGLKAPKVLSEDDVMSHKSYKDLFRIYNQSQDNLKALKALIADLNQSLVETSIQGLDGDVSKIKDNFDTVLAELDKLKKQLEEAEANKVDVNTLTQDDLKDNLCVKLMIDKTQKLTQTLRDTVKASNSLKTDKDSLEAQLNEAKEAKETAENELSELNTKSSELINARNSEINKLKERIAELDSEIESKEGCISALEKQNKQLISRVELLNSNAIRLTAQLASMQNELQLAKDNTNKFENDDDELNDIEESSTPLKESVENEEPEDESIGLSDEEESSTPLKESTKSEEPEEESTENISPSTNAEDEDLDNLLKEADFLIKETQKPSATSAASQPATKTAKTETQEKTSTFASQSVAETESKKKTSASTYQSAAKTESKKSNTKNQFTKEKYEELFGDYVTDYILPGVDTETFDDSSVDSKNKKDQSMEDKYNSSADSKNKKDQSIEDKYNELFGDYYMTPGNPAENSDQ